jgi:hypothetical protein
VEATVYDNPSLSASEPVKMNCAEVSSSVLTD